MSDFESLSMAGWEAAARQEAGNPPAQDPAQATSPEQIVSGLEPNGPQLSRADKVRRVVAGGVLLVGTALSAHVVKENMPKHDEAMQATSTPDGLPGLPKKVFLPPIATGVLVGATLYRPKFSRQPKSMTDFDDAAERLISDHPLHPTLASAVAWRRAELYRTGEDPKEIRRFLRQLSDLAKDANPNI